MNHRFTRNGQLACFALSLISLLLSACSTYPAPTNTPPTATLTTQITESTAILTAKNAIGSTRLRLISVAPRVALAQLMPLAAAHTITRQRQSGPTTTAIETQPVWLVVFESNYQITPPGPDATPLPIKHGCVFTIIAANDGAPREVAGEIPCPK